MTFSCGCSKSASICWVDARAEEEHGEFTGTVLEEILDKQAIHASLLFFTDYIQIAYIIITGCSIWYYYIGYLNLLSFPSYLIVRHPTLLFLIAAGNLNLSFVTNYSNLIFMHVIILICWSSVNTDLWLIHIC